MEKDAFVVVRAVLEQVYAQAEKKHLDNTKTLLKAILELCPPVNRQLAQSAPCLMKALDELLGVINIDDSGYCYICQQALHEVEVATATIVWATGYSISQHVKEALEGLMENLNQDEDGNWFLGKEGEPFINAAEFALAMFHGDRPAVGTSIAHQLKDANAAIAIQNKRIEWFYGFAYGVRTLLERCAAVLEDRGSYSWTKHRALEVSMKRMKTQVEATLPAASKEEN